MKIQATISSAEYPEYGSVTVQFPIPTGDYENILDLLGPMGMGGAIQRDCYLEKLTGDYPVLKGLERSNINLDELDYLAKRLESFDAREKMKFNATAVRLGIKNVQDFINLTFWCQQATVIADFSDLELIGKRHYLTVHGGCASAEELDKVDGRQMALDLIQNHDGYITPYGVVYDNGMVLEQRYDGRHFPEYLYDDALLELRVTSKHPNQDHTAEGYICLPVPDSVIQRILFRSEIAPDDIQLHFESDALPQAVADVLDITGEDIYELNGMCRAIRDLDSGDLDKLSAAVLLAKPESAFEIGEIAKNLELFDFIPGVKDAGEYGKYMIQESGHFEYDPNLDNFYNYSQYGWSRINREGGQFNELGYIAYKGTLTMEELLHGDPVERMDQRVDGMGGMALG